MPDQRLATVKGVDVAYVDEGEGPVLVLLHGSGTTEIAFVYQAEGSGGRKRTVKRSHPFEGVIPTFERRWRETDSAAVREDLARYQAPKPCAECGGTRLKREARHVFLQGQDPGVRGLPIYAVEHATLADCLAHFEALHLVGNKADIAEKVMRARLENLAAQKRIDFLPLIGLWAADAIHLPA